MLHTDRLTVRGPGLANFSVPQDRALLVVGDAHGQNIALRDLLGRLGRMPTPGKRRTLVFLGDLIDRGPDSLGCLATALDDAAELAQADEAVFLPGNHELLMADAIADAHKDAGARKDGAAETWFMNGGFAFLEEAFEKAGAEMPRDPWDAIRRFAELLPCRNYASPAAMIADWPSHYRFGDVLCVHAGIKPKQPHGHTLDLAHEDHFPVDRRAVGMGKHNRHWAWIRDDFLAWQGGWPASGDHNDDGALVLHGHTVPAGCRSSRLTCGDDVAGMFDRMATNARICLDGGAARDVGVAGAIVAEDAVRICFAPT